MTCTCGAKMCYICKAKGVDYDHFYGQVVLFPTQGYFSISSDLRSHLAKTVFILHK